MAPLEAIAEWNLDRIADLEREVQRLTAAVEHFRSACIKGEDEVQQILGLALGYPRFSDDPKNFPDCDPEDKRVNVGPHTAASLAMEAAERIENLEDRDAFMD